MEDGRHETLGAGAYTWGTKEQNRPGDLQRQLRSAQAELNAAREMAARHKDQISEMTEKIATLEEANRRLEESLNKAMLRPNIQVSQSRLSSMIRRYRPDWLQDRPGPCQRSCWRECEKRWRRRKSRMHSRVFPDVWQLCLPHRKKPAIWRVRQSPGWSTKCMASRRRSQVLRVISLPSRSAVLTVKFWGLACGEPGC